jgi:hypothetical protein
MYGSGTTWKVESGSGLNRSGSTTQVRAFCELRFYAMAQLSGCDASNDTVSHAVYLTQKFADNDKKNCFRNYRLSKELTIYSKQTAFRIKKVQPTVWPDPKYFFQFYRGIARETVFQIRWIRNYLASRTRIRFQIITILLQIQRNVRKKLNILYI